MLHSIVTLTLVIITNCPIVSTNQGPSGGRTHVSVRQDNMGACEQNPCENGGDCNILASESRVVDPEDMFVCHCMTGFYGKKCEQGSGISLNCTDTEMSVSVAHSLTSTYSLAPKHPMTPLNPCIKLINIVNKYKTLRWVKINGINA